MKRANWLGVLLILVLCAPVPGFGFGLEVDPAEIVVQGCPLGEKVAVSALAGEQTRLRIKNASAVAYTYTINVILSAQAGSRLKEGNLDIPDTGWIISEPKEVRVPANSVAEVELYLKVPRNKKFANKRYQAIIEVKSKKNAPEDIFVLAAQIEMFFSTSALGKGK